VDGDLLQAGTALTQATAIVREHPGAFPPQLEDYVQRSANAAAARLAAERKRAEADARRSRWLMRAAVIIALAFMGLSVLIYAFYNRAQESELATRHQACSPHSTLPVPAQRPAEICSPSRKWPNSAVTT